MHLPYMLPNSQTTKLFVFSLMPKSCVFQNPYHFLDDTACFFAMSSFIQAMSIFLHYIYSTETNNCVPTTGNPKTHVLCNCHVSCDDHKLHSGHEDRAHYINWFELVTEQALSPTFCQLGDSCAFRCWRGRPQCCRLADNQSHICWNNPPTLSPTACGCIR